MPSALWDAPFDDQLSSPASSSDEYDGGDDASTISSFDEDEDEDEVNSRVRPHWPSYQDKLRGFRLDTVEDVKAFYSCSTDGRVPEHFLMKHSGDVNDALCPDAGLVSLVSQHPQQPRELASPQPDNLFRGTRLCDGAKVVIKAVHLHSRELAVIRFLSTPPLRHDPMNHCIRASATALFSVSQVLIMFRPSPAVLDLIELHEENLAFIVMEQVSRRAIICKDSSLRI
jgi:hypothetical protein